MFEGKSSEVCNGILSVTVFVNFNTRKTWIQKSFKESEDLERLGFWAFSPVLRPMKPTSNVRIEIIDEINDVRLHKITIREDVGSMIRT